MTSFDIPRAHSPNSRALKKGVIREGRKRREGEEEEKIEVGRKRGLMLKTLGQGPNCLPEWF